MIDRVATDWRAAGRGERNCELSAPASLGWVAGTGCTVNLLAVTADSCHNVQVLQRQVLLKENLSEKKKRNIFLSSRIPK